MMKGQLMGAAVSGGLVRLCGAVLVGLVGLLSTPAPGAGQLQRALADEAPDSRGRAPGAPPALVLERTTRPIRVDGVLDDAAWQSVPSAGGFVQQTPDEGRAATAATDVKVLLNGDALYVGVRLWDDDAESIVARLGRRDSHVYSDWIYVYLDSYHDRRSAFAFGVNAAGVQRDLRYFDDTRTDTQWDAVWASAVTRDAEGWTAELAIPLSQLRFNAMDEDWSWGVNFARTIARKNETSHWAPIPNSSNSFVSLFGELMGSDGLTPPHRVELIPYSSARVEMKPGDAADPFYRSRDTKPSVGGDVRVGLGSSMTLSATVNPDFGQVEADPARVNLTAFELFEQERRPFFTEGADIFQLTHPSWPPFFYSRRIGRTPHGGLPSEAAYSDRPTATTILSALKLSGKTADGWSIGLMEALTAPEEARYVDAAGQEGAVDVEPTSNYAVARVSRELREGRSSIGLMATAVNRSGTGDQFRYLHGAAYGLALDGHHRFASGGWELRGGVLSSHVRGDTLALQRTQRASGHYFQRPDAQHLTYDPGLRSLSGLSANAELLKLRGSWRGGVSVQSISPGYEVGDLGFNTNNDRITSNVWGRYQDLTPGRIFRRKIISGSSFYLTDFAGQRLELVNNAGVSLQLLNYWGFSVNAMRHSPAWLPTALRGGPSLRRPGRWMGGANIHSDSRQPVNGNLGLFWTTEDESGGYNLSFNGGVSVRPSDRMDLRLSPSVALARLAWQYVGVESLQDEQVYLVGGLDQRTVSLSVRANYTVSPTLSLELYARPYLAAGQYDAFREVRDPRAAIFSQRFRTYGPQELRDDPDRDGWMMVDRDGDGVSDFSLRDPSFNLVSLQVNAVLRWEYRPGSTLYAVWTQDRRGYGQDSLSFQRDLDRLWDAPSDNVLMIKVAYWLGM